MDRHFKTEGVVIRKVHLNEADVIATLLSPDYGKIHCLAKGARRLKSRFCGRLELFCHVQVTGFQGRGELGYLDEAETLDGASLFGLKLPAHGALFSIAELTNRLIQDGQRAEGVYELLTETLEWVARDLRDREMVILQTYLIKFLTRLGFMGPWDRCCLSGHKLNLLEPVYFHANDGSLLGSGYAQPADTRLPAPIVKWVNFMQQYAFEDILKVSVSSGERQQVEQLLRVILRNLLSTPLKSDLFLRAAVPGHAFLAY